ncbi:MAG: SpaA isopeptide-forming pilin-related protein [Chloroflexi bacterium]|nr:SpaA isopeptide-forming pilin-related protein [Chloroflexota bacterium]
MQYQTFPTIRCRRIPYLFGLGICLVFGGLLLNLLVEPARIAYAATCVGTTITGTAFRDYNATGAKDPDESGIGGIIVTAYAANGAVASCETTTTGAYGIDPAGAFPVRLEFTLPANGHLNFLQPGVNGPGSGTTVTFLNAPATGINIGFNNPAQFCGVNSTPDLATSCYVFGEQNNNPSGVNKDSNVFYSFPYTAGSTDLANEPAVRNPLPTQRAKAQEIGATWGLAWNPLSQTIYAAAFMKRHVGFGPHGPGAIYQLPTVGAPTLFYDFGALAGADPHPQPGATCLSLGHNPNNTNANCWLNDSNAFDAVGKVGFGDLEISDDFKTLYGVNLAANTLMAIPVANPAAVVSIPVPVPASCPAADLRPFGLGVNDGVVYLGLVCSAESSQDRTKLRAYVYAYANGAFAATPTLDIPLTYDRGASNLQWQYWLNRTTFNKNNPTQAGGKWAQPWLTDITFDHGDMILGFRDRNGDLFGTVAGGPDPADTQNYSSIARGDILRACANGNGGWSLESNGQCGAITTAGANTGEGPGGGEYYFQDHQVSPMHNETSLGAQLQIPGQPDVVSLIFNPIEGQGAVSDGGVKWYNNTTGTTSRGYLIFDATGKPTLFSKSNGLGDLVALCPPASTEIGNRVWRDSNANGIQDPDELGIDGVVVELYRNGTLVGSTTTANGGQYYFNDSNVNQNGANGIVPGTGAVGANSEYEIRIPNVSGASQQAPLAGLSLTGVHQDASANGNLRDSDASLSGVNALYAIPYENLINAGDNNHTYDVGFVAGVTPPPATVSLGNQIWTDANNNGLIDSGEVGIANVTVNLYQDSNQDGLPDGAIVATQVTNSAGYYLFTNLATGTYLVEVVPPAGLTSSTGGNSEPAPGPNTNLADNDDNCTMKGNVALTGPVTLVVGGAPIGEPATPGLPDSTPDANANYTVDCGFFPVSQSTTLASLGDFVWFDQNSNGIQNVGETPLAGITVTLYSGVGAPLSVTHTDVNGLYHFTSLTPGDYHVCFTLPTGGTFTQANQGADDGKDSDADQATGCTPVTTLTDNENDLTWDAGVIVPPPLQPAALGGCTWNDGLESLADVVAISLRI